MLGKFIKLLFCGLLFNSFILFGEIDFLKIYPNFDESLQRNGLSEVFYTQLFESEEIVDKKYQDFRKKAKNLYEYRRSIPFMLPASREIPRIVHQIWLGSAVPEEFKQIMSTWQGWKGWTYKLWTDEDIQELGLYNQELYDEAKNYGERSDIARYEILYRFGGLYVDTDFECTNPAFFDFAHRNYSFFVGIEPLEHQPMSCCNALMASCAHHPIMKRLVYRVTENAKRHSDEWTVGRTGPRFLTSIIYKNFSELYKTGGILFPPTFFYPILQGEHEALFNDYNFFVKPETMGIHYWEMSWLHGKGLTSINSDSN